MYQSEEKSAEDESVLSDNESLVDQVTNSFPFIPSASLIKDGRNYRCIIKAIKDEIEKGLDALKGFHLEGRATMKSAVKSGFYDFSSGHYLAFNRGITHTRGVDDPYE